MKTTSSKAVAYESSFEYQMSETNFRNKNKCQMSTIFSPGNVRISDTTLLVAILYKTLFVLV